MLNGRRVRGFGLGDAPDMGGVNHVPRALKYGALGAVGLGAVAAGISYAATGEVRGLPVVVAAVVGAVGGGALGSAQAATPAAPAGPISLTVSDTPVIQGVNAASGTLLTLSLPPGAAWKTVSVGTPGNEFMGNLVQTVSAAPITLPVPPIPGATVNTNWTTPDGKAHFQAVAFLPPGATLATPVTDAAAVTAVQNVINGISPEIAVPGWQKVPVNGNAADPGLVKQIAAVQNLAVSEFTKAGRPVALRTDGVLDYATYALFSVPL